MRVTSKGQVTIPLELRERYGIRPESEVVFEPREDGVLIRPARPAAERMQEWLESVRGVATTGRRTAEIMEMTRGEK
jgi:AbrB family looped-hinge helix DNA binding protein